MSMITNFVKSRTRNDLGKALTHRSASQTKFKKNGRKKPENLTGYNRSCSARTETVTLKTAKSRHS